jgi:type I restriction enzyme M protein
MLNAETKRHIDSARQVLVGKIPDPKSQIEQITNALIYKFMDDMDARAISHGGQPTFFVENLKEYSWSKLMDRSIGAQERMNKYDEALRKFGTAKQLPPLFRTIFKEALLPFKSPETLNLFLNEITYFNYKNSEELGNAFEYLLSTLGTQGDAGQFRTPRHIIDFIVKVIDPKKTDTILDPACGTAGFLISAFKHIAESHDGVDSNGKPNDEKRLTPLERKKIMENITGYDISPDMVRLSLVNMYLHGSQYGLQNPNIVEYDTLSQTDRWDEKFDVMLANPPFMTPKGGIIPHNKFEISANRAEVLFIDYIKTHLKPNGRAGIIVPEGIIFQSSNAYKELRKLLVEDGLYAVVSLPSGVFNPYSGVKTSILFFDNTVSKQTKKMLFIKVDNDGYDLGAQRREHKKDDLPQAIEILKEFKLNPDKKFKDSSFAWVVDKSKILDTNDYSLAGERYKESTKKSSDKYPMVELGDVVEILDSKRKPITKSERKSGIYPYYGATGILDYVENYIFEERLVLIGEDGAKWNSGDKTAFIAEGKYWVNNHAHVVKPIKEKLIDTYLVELLNNLDLTPWITGVTVPKLNQEKLRSIKIPLPPIEIQKEIVAEIESKQSIIDGARDLIQKVERERANSGYLFEQLDCELVNIGDICELVNGRAFKPTDWELPNGKNLPIIRIQNLNNPNAEFNYYSGKVDPKLIIENGDLLFSWSGSRGTSFGAHIWKGQTAILNQHIFKVNFRDIVLKEYLHIALNNAVSTIEQNLNGGVGLVHITKGNLEKIKLAVPSIEVQKEIIKKFESQNKSIEANKNLIDLFENQVKDIVNRVFEA